MENKAENKIQRNSLVLLKKIDKNVGNLTGDTNEFEIDLSLTLPLQSMEELIDMEERLRNDDFATAAVSVINFLNYNICIINRRLITCCTCVRLIIIIKYFIVLQTKYFRTKMVSNKFEAIFRSITADKVYFEFNLNGNHGKRKLLSLNLFNTVLRSKY